MNANFQREKNTIHHGDTKSRSHGEELEKKPKSKSKSKPKQEATEKRRRALTFTLKNTLKKSITEGLDRSTRFAEPKLQSVAFAGGAAAVDGDEDLDSRKGTRNLNCLAG